MTYYASRGPATSGGSQVYAVADDVPAGAVDRMASMNRPCVEKLDLRLDLRNHSPTGFSWGYGGSGPAQLALAILAHAKDDEYALEHYQELKSEVIAAKDDEEQFVLTEREFPEVLV